MAISEMDEADARRRMSRLRWEIRIAEARLSALNAAILNASTDAGLESLRVMHAENERLRAHNNQIHEQVSTATAALEAAIRVSETDPLTKLPNRVVLWDRLNHDLTLARRHGTMLAVMFLDLDDFKAINDAHGHEIGDQLLCAVAAELSAAVRATDTVCRIGGDEFVLVLPDIGRDDLDLVAAKIGALVATVRQFGSHAVHSSASIGCSVYPDDGEFAETLVKQADLAMYRAKRLRQVPPARGVG